MANELWISNRNELLTIYCIIRKKSDWTVLNPTTGSFVSWVDGDIGDYDIPLTYQDGDIYSADHPDITEGILYLYSYYIQGGATPATTDTLLDTVEGAWNGTGVVPAAAGVVLSGYALTTLEEVKRELNIPTATTTYDDYLTQLINQESAAIERELDRKIVARDYTDMVRAKRGQIKVNNTPIISVNRIAYGSGTAFTVKYTGSCLRATFQVGVSQIKGIVIADDGTTTTKTINLGATVTAQTIVSTINAWDGSSWWVAELKNNCLSTDLFTSKAIPVNGSTPKDICYPPIDDSNAYILDEAGIIGLNINNNYDYVVIAYRSGYETIPDDISQYCIQRIVDSYSLRGAPKNVKSVSLEGYSYSLGNMSESTLEMRKNIINKYKKWGIA